MLTDNEIQNTINPESEWKEILLSGNDESLKTLFREIPIADLARICNQEDDIETGHLIRFVPQDKLSQFFEHLNFYHQLELMKHLPVDTIAKTLNDIPPDDRTAFFQQLPGAELRKWLKMLSPEERKMAVSLLEYPEDSIGRLMTPEFISVKEEWSIEQSLAHIRRHGPNSETLNVVYVVDSQGRLIDDLKIREILLAPLHFRISDIRDKHYVSLNAYDDQEIAISIFKETDRFALPVTDFGGLLVGIVTSDDVLDVMEEEDTEDIQKFGGMESLEYPYVKTGFFSLVGKRAGWLTILFLGEMLTASAMGYFQHEIAHAIVLALFIPLIISSGGNSGSQAATLIIRALALNEITLKDWWYVMRKEILSGFTLGIILGTIGFLRITTWQLTGWYDYGSHWILIAFTVFFSLIGIVLWGTLIGSMIPIILKKLKLDPAASSAPFVATLVDVTGLIIYFSIAAILLSGTLL